MRCRIVRDSGNTGRHRQAPADHRPRLIQVVTAPVTARLFLEGQLRFMRDNGFHVTIVSSPGDQLDEVAARDGVDAIGIPMRRSPSPGHDIVSLCRMLRLFRRLRPHIVHAGTPKAGLLCGLAARLARVPVRLFTVHGIRSEGLRGVASRVMAALESLSCRSAHRVVCVSDSVRRKAIDLGMDRPEKFVVLGRGSANGIDASRFERSPELLGRARALRRRVGLPERAPVVGFVGRLVRDKGVIELVDAYRKLRRDLPELRLLLVGPREAYNALPRELFEHIERDEGIVSTGSLGDTAPAYALMDVLALPTYREGFPNVPLEAAAMELPVVATRVTGCVDAVVDGVTGTLVPPRDAEALAEATGRYLSAPGLCRRHGRAGRERVLREFRQERVWTALYDEYLRLLSWKGTPAPFGR